MLPDHYYPADPYPGAVPDCSFVHLDEHSHPVRPDGTATSGWRVVHGGTSGRGGTSGDTGTGTSGRDGTSTSGRGGTSGDTGTGTSGRGTDLDDWLGERGAEQLADRIPLLSYGSNRCPSKITWLRRELGLSGPVVVLRVTTRDVAAVWAAGLRKRDGQRPAVLVAAPGAVEEHAVWFATPDQMEVLDRCEGRDDRYRLARPPITVRTEDGALIERPWCYLALAPTRQPLLVGDVEAAAQLADPRSATRRHEVRDSPDGWAPVRCTDLAQRHARYLEGVPAATDGLDAPTVTGAPRAREWPATLFAYGLLQPGGTGWPLVAPHHHGPLLSARARGTLYDTGLGWPALLLDVDPSAGRGALDGGSDAGHSTPGAAVGWQGPSGPGVAGTLIPLRDPVSALPALDDYEGPDYRRIRLRLDDGQVAWAYLWQGDRSILRPPPM